LAAITIPVPSANAGTTWASEPATSWKALGYAGWPAEAHDENTSVSRKAADPVQVRDGVGALDHLVRPVDSRQDGDEDEQDTQADSGEREPARALGVPGRIPRGRRPLGTQGEPHEVRHERTGGSGCHQHPRPPRQVHERRQHGGSGHDRGAEAGRDAPGRDAAQPCGVRHRRSGKQQDRDAEGERRQRRQPLAHGGPP
jgi:hypothetical protein